MLIHYDTLDNWKPHAVKLEEQPNPYKPGGGIWCAFDGGNYPMEQWQRDNGYLPWIMTRKAYKIELKRNFKLFVIQKGFKVSYPWASWNELAREYDLIVFLYWWGARYVPRLTGWDYDQAVILNADIIKNVTRCN